MQAAFDRAVALVGELADACAARGATLIVAVIPSVVQADPERFERFRASRPARHRDSLRRTLLHERLIAALREHAVIVDLLPALEQRILRGEACYHREGHFNARGHALAADLLAPRLAEALGGTGTDGGSGTDGAGPDR
jgi:hypothetical protein